MDFVVVCHGKLDGLALCVGRLQGLGDCGHFDVFPVRLQIMTSYILPHFDLALYIDLKCESHPPSCDMCYLRPVDAIAGSTTLCPRIASSLRTSWTKTQ